MSWNDALILTFEYLSSVIPATIVGIVLMELLIELGWIQKLGFVTAPFMRFGHIREEVGGELPCFLWLTHGREFHDR